MAFWRKGAAWKKGAVWRKETRSYKRTRDNSGTFFAMDTSEPMDTSEEMSVSYMFHSRDDSESFYKSDSSDDSESSSESDSSEESDSSDDHDLDTSDMPEKRKKNGYLRSTDSFEDKKENGNIIRQIYNTGLNHDDWSEAMDTFLICKRYGDHNPKIMRNHPENHAERLLIRHLRKKCKGKKKPLTFTVYMNNSPCSSCAKALGTFLNKNKNVKLTFFVTSLYHIKRNSCFKAKHFEHLNSIPRKSHKANSEGLKDLLRHKRCYIKAFNMGAWKTLLNTLEVLPKVNRKLIGGYHRIQYGQKRSRGYEDDLIKKDLTYIRNRLREQK